MAKILIVDDDAHLLLLYEQEFTDDGHAIVCARNGREALRLARERKPDLVILDIAMPGMDGIETLGKLLAQDRALPVILNTAYGIYKDNFMTWSADAYVVKSGDLGELKSEADKLLKSRVAKARPFSCRETQPVP